jgi:hypothetical protein
MLTYIYDHLLEDALLRHLRLINWADLVSVAEQFVNEIDWTRIAPGIRSALAMIHYLTPLSDHLISAAGINIEEARRETSIEYFWQYQGWPCVPIIHEPAARILRVLRNSFFPPAWWLCFYYGLNKTQVAMPGRVVLHPLFLLSRFTQAMLGRAKRVR